ncbi:hypothetical protein A3I40_03065 [Candidatus Uhrbacteria bacterium RIFCSPLOWO2_02_FULL_48_12]|uniref:Uncharacterized protein n=1 Tax=Candidatus Uhrbacteria bacterium RIFCSPLOWO2_02_FULL_48_12 TaxID=1802407 RepID=A0A1F7V5J3_9BACT|nr:MAG: hypothetical protein A3I40_03065 [Candidatus Uhrbacteria bacterium RIFCSPLOWO2_02_FULL_48_12]
MDIDRFTVGQLRAFASIVTGDDDALIDAVLRREKQAVWQNVVRLYFERHGRYISPRGLKARVCDPNRDFRLTQPTLTCADELTRFDYAFEGKVTLPSVAEYEDRTSALIEQVRATAGIANALSGVHLRWFMSQMEITNHGKLVQLLAGAVKRSYEAHDFRGKHPRRKLNNYCHGELEGQVTVIPESHLDRLVERLKAGPVFGVQFPNCLQGYSMHAQREVMATAPQGFILSGPETLVTMAIYPETLARDFKAHT